MLIILSYPKLRRVHTQVYGTSDSYLHSDMYTFNFGSGADRAPLKARFSMVWRKHADGWKITHMHSSVRPETAEDKARTKKQMEVQAAANFKAWTEAVRTGLNNYEKVSSMYSKNDLSFLPTVSPNHITKVVSTNPNEEDTEDYFKTFVQKQPLGYITIKDNILQEKVQVCDADCYVHSGLYTFEMDTWEGDQKSRPESVQSSHTTATSSGRIITRKTIAARFSYMWRQEADGWKIAHHHSSVVPS
jgi:hypothetical protein